ncbi:MAG: NFACT family protein [Nitrososphaerota archaeon]
MLEKPRFEINSMDLTVLLREIDKSQPRYVSQIYRGVDSSYILRLKGPEDVRDLKIVSGKAIFLAPGVYQTHGQLDDFSSSLRRYLKGCMLRSVEQVVGERIARLRFEGRGVMHDFLVEVFPGGGLSLLDERGIVLLSTNLRRGEPYSWPVRKATVSGREDALALLSSVEGRLKIGVALARELGLGTKYSNEVLARTGVPPSKKVAELGDDEKMKIAAGVEYLLKLLENPMPTAYKTGDIYVAFAPFPLIHLGKQGFEETRTTSLNEAVSLVYESYVRAVEISEHRQKIEEEVRRIEKEIAEKRAFADRLRLKAQELRELATMLHSRLAELKDLWTEIKAGGQPGGILKSLDMNTGLVTLELDGRAVQLSIREPVTDQIDRLFKNAKTTMKGVENLLREISELEEKVSRLKSTFTAPKVVEVIEVRRRGTEWFHSYRWSMTSGGRLVVLGRDASSNIRLLKKHLEKGDIVLHAEVKGSPVAILKDGAGAGEEELREAATLCASFSRAWREGLSTMSVYWVAPDQISFTPPQGMYLPRGSFIVKPPKNYIHVPLQICIGYSEKLGPIVGVESWVRAEAVVYAVLSPGQEDASIVAKALAAKVGEILNLSPGQLRPSGFEALIPYGKCRVLSWSR